MPSSASTAAPLLARRLRLARSLSLTQCVPSHSVRPLEYVFSCCCCGSAFFPSQEHDIGRKSSPICISVASSCVSAKMKQKQSQEIATMTSGRLRILAEGKVKPLKPQRRTQGKGKCSAKHSAPCPQSGRQERLIAPLTPFQLYFKQTELTNKADFLKDPAAAFFSNPDTDVGLPTPLIPQPLITGQLGPGLLTNPTQQLGVALPGQETSKVQAPEELSDPLLQGQQINFSYLSSPIAHKNSQAGRIVTMAQVHAQEQETSLGAHLQVFTGNPSNSELPISTGNATEVYNDTGTGRAIGSRKRNLVSATRVTINKDETGYKGQAIGRGLRTSEYEGAKRQGER
ncbi:hypothetical protein NDU88_004695 [Pleurodeles waltl]|uniref:Uncharacterized protein n=1 Tax=Pleurodeles waltl TaxID=8319 RepID=A0AAV7MU86_PLEWA|nr:hypothetical protein NDU88_004695 [Pleurodeles waltl]